MRKYTPRRAGKRWLEGAPEYVLDVLDDKDAGERYTVMFCGSELISDGTRTGTYISFLGMSGAPTHPCGVSMFGELQPHEAAAYRYRCKHHRIRWLDLPENIREHVKARVRDANKFAKQCEGCNGRKYRLATRGDGTRSIERCDTCSMYLTDKQASALVVVELETAHETLEALLAWADFMGGWEARCWRNARDIIHPRTPS